MPLTNGDPYFHPINHQSLVILSLEDRYDRILEVIARSEYAEQVSPELYLELADIIRQLEDQ